MAWCDDVAAQRERSLPVPLQPCSDRHRHRGTHIQWWSTVICIVCSRGATLRMLEVLLNWLITLQDVELQT